jgi:hypothetical protein
VNATSLSGKPESGEGAVAQVRWRPVREGHEKEDRAFNEHLADRLLNDPAVDDIVIALGFLNWRLIGPDGQKWPMVERTVPVPSWALSVAEQDREARRGAAIAVEIDRHLPRPKVPRRQVAA